MQFVRYIFLLFVIVSLAYAAPAEDEAEVAVPKAEKKKDTADDRAVLDVDQTWETWLTANSYTILTSTLGVLFLAGGLAMVGYYFVYLNYYAYNNLDQSVYNPYYGSGSNQYAQPYPAYTVSSRSIDSGSSWSVSWPQVLYMISLAQETYEKFDFQSLECQKKALCELSQKQTDFGETGRKISSTFSYASKRFLDVVEGLPMPKIIQTYLKEYKDALNQGKNSSQDCSEVYTKCNFSVKEMIQKYQKRAAAGKF